MGMREKLMTANERRQQVEQELNDLRNVKADSNNIALGDLEAALMAELNSIESQIRQINSYIQQVDQEAGATA